ncbi:MAG: FtsX-like permease family protein [Ectothiorhodospiraceae bacterium]
MIGSLLRRASARHLLGHPWQLVLALVGVAIGVAVVVAVDLANQSASRGFSLSVDALTGEATHRVVAGPEGLAEEWYVRLRSEAGVRPSAPVVEGFVDLPDHGGRSLRVLGVDVFAEAGIRPAVGGVAAQVEPGALLARGDGAVLLEQDLERLGLSSGDRFTVRHAGRDHELRVLAGVTPERRATATGLRDVLIMDIAAAQELLGRVGRLDRVDLVLDDAAAREAVEAELPPGARLVPADRRAQQLGEMTAAFQLNLQAFSLLALVVGAFLIYNTMTFSVVQRRRLLGLLRAGGATRRELLGVVLGEALVLGVTGTILGLALGTTLAQVLVDLVTRTINDLYFSLAVSELSISAGSLARGAVLGVGMTLVAALLPALEAARVPPRAALSRAYLEQRHRSWLPWLAALGVVLLAIGGFGLVASERGLVVPFAALFVVILGGAVLVPPLLWCAGRALAPVLGRSLGLVGRMAARGLTASLSRTGVAASALVVAVSAVIGVGVMVDSFRTTFADWLDATLHADIYISVAGDGALEPAQRERLLAVPGVATATQSRFVRVGAGERDARLRVFQIPSAAEGGFRFIDGDPETAWQRYRRGEAVLITEPYAWHRELGVGDDVTLTTGSGEQRFPVAGVVRDYGTSEGAIIMARATYDRYWDDPRVDSLGIHASDGVDPERLRERLASAAARGEQRLDLRSDHAIRERSLAIFDRTFTITEVLRLLAILVAVTGVLSALLALALERVREYAVLRAGGLTTRELAALVTGQNALVGLLSGLLAIPLGLALAAALILVINRRSFGWTLELAVDPWILIQAVALAVAAAVAAGLYPAWRVARTPPARAMQED